MRALLDKKADPNIPDFTGRRALSYAKVRRTPIEAMLQRRAGGSDGGDGETSRRAAPIRITGTLALDPGEIEESFVRAAGPGGQHVNTTSTAVQLRFDVRHSPSLPEDVRQRLERLAGRRLTRNGVLVLVAQGERSQLRNREGSLG